MATYSQSELDGLISCPKEISEAPKKGMKLCEAHFRNDAKLIASNGISGEFGMFMRQSEDFPENFSIGLTYSPQDGRNPVTLLRCNGKHGTFNGSFDPTHPHWDYHIHRADETAIEAGLAAERVATKTAEYASFEEALQFFVRTVNLSPNEAQKYFPPRPQATFDFEP